MSSSAQFTVGGSVVAGILTITGNSGGAVGPTGGGNINIVGDGFINIVGSPGTNTLTVSLANGGNATVTTTDDTPTPLISIAVPEGESVIISVTIVATESTGADSFGGTIVLTVLHYTGGDVSVVGVPTINSNTTSTASIQGTVDTGTQEAVITVTGVIAQTWNWSSTYQYILI